MATITEIRTALAANLATLEGFQPSAYVLSNPTPPAIQILPGDIEYDLSMHRGLDRPTMLIQAFVSLTSDIGSQVLLDRLLDPTGPQSLKTAAESDPTLGGLVGGVHVTTATGYRQAQGANGPILVCEWTAEILASN